MKSIPELGLETCSECKHRYDCAVRPRYEPYGEGIFYEWLKEISYSHRHSVAVFDGIRIYASHKKCVSEIKFSTGNQDWANVMNDEVVFTETFIKELKDVIGLIMTRRSNDP